jgi:hypothetical protein
MNIIRIFTPRSITALLVAGLALVAATMGTSVARADDLPLSAEGKEAQSYIDSIEANPKLQRDDATAARNRAMDAFLAANALVGPTDHRDVAAYNAALARYQEALRSYANSMKDLSEHQSTYEGLKEKAQDAISLVTDDAERAQLETNLAAQTPENYRGIGEALDSANKLIRDAKAKADAAAALFALRCATLTAVANAKPKPIESVWPVSPQPHTPTPSGTTAQPQTPATQPCNSGTPRVTSNISQGAPGTLVQLTISGFPPNAVLSFLFADNAGHIRRAREDTVLANAQGSLTITVAVPNVTPGPHVIRAVDGGRCGAQPSTPFTILAR